MNINQHNYEAYFLDYWEKRLTATQQDLLFRFLEMNPDLRPEFESYEAIEFRVEKAVQFTGKEKLKTTVIQKTRDIDASNYESYLIGAVEHDLNKEQKQQLDIFLHHNPALKDELLAYHSTKLSADQSIRYLQKEKLYQRQARIISLPNLYRTVAAAASLLILFGIYQVFKGPASLPDYRVQERVAALSINKISIDHIPQSGKQEIILSDREQATPHGSMQTIRQDPMHHLQAISFESSFIPFDPDIAYAHHAGPDLSYPLEYYAIMANYRLGLLASGSQLKEKSFAGKIISGLFNKVSDRVKPEIDALDVMRPNKVTFWDLAESGVNGYNYLTDKDLTLVRTIDQNGRTRKVRILEDGEEIPGNGER